MSVDFPIYRPRRTRATENLRAMIRETEVSVKDLIYPIFVVPGTNVKHEIESLPGNYHWSIDRLGECMDEVASLGIPAVLLFGVPSYKDAVGSSAWDMNEPVQLACKFIKANYPEIVIITDVCMCEYTEHGHCGVLQNGCTVNNDETLPLLAKVAVSHCQAGTNGFINLAIHITNPAFCGGYGLSSVYKIANVIFDIFGIGIDNTYDNMLRRTVLNDKDGLTYIITKESNQTNH